MKILIPSNTPWSSDNSFGNTFTNLFSDLPDLEVANIYTRYGMPDHNGIVSHYYQITEGDLRRRLPGRSFTDKDIPESETKKNDQQAKTRYDFFRRHRWRIFFWARELLWKTGKWDTPELRRFIDDFHPDLIYLPIYNSGYMLDMGLFLKKYTGVPMIGHISDDNYSLKRFSLSPFFWLDRFWKRGKIRKIAAQSKFFHVITEKQKEEYEDLLRVECRVFRKALDFDEANRYRHELHDPVRYVYTGNIGANRWKMLARLGQVLEGGQGELYIYSPTPLDAKMQEAFEKRKAVRLMGSVSALQCTEIQKEADVLVAVESDRLRERLAVRLSLSTKIIDYLHTGNCILSIGAADGGSMEYLMEGDAAVCVTENDSLEEKVGMLDADTIRAYGDRAWNYGKEMNDQKKVKAVFYQDLLDGASHAP